MRRYTFGHCRVSPENDPFYSFPPACGDLRDFTPSAGICPLSYKLHLVMAVTVVYYSAVLSLKSKSIYAGTLSPSSLSDSLSVSLCLVELLGFLMLTLWSYHFSLRTDQGEGQTPCRLLLPGCQNHDFFCLFILVGSLYPVVGSNSSAHPSVHPLRISQKIWKIFFLDARVTCHFRPLQSMYPFRHMPRLHGTYRCRYRTLHCIHHPPAPLLPIQIPTLPRWKSRSLPPVVPSVSAANAPADISILGTLHAEGSLRFSFS